MQTVAVPRFDAPAPSLGSPRDLNAQPLLTALRSASSLAALPAAALTRLAAMSSLRSFSAGQVVLARGQHANEVFAVVRGQVRATRATSRGRQVTLATYRPGQLCLDGLFAADAQHAADWVASETSLLLFVPREELLAEVRQHPDVLLGLATDLDARLRDSRAMAAGVVLDDVETRLLDLLDRLARAEGEPTEEGTLLRRCPTQQEIANMIGACRETVSRLVAEMVRQSKLIVRGRHLTLTAAFPRVSAPSPGL